MENFVHDVFSQDREYFLPQFDKHPLLDMDENLMTLAQVTEKLEAVWAKIPSTNQIGVTYVVTRVDGDEGEVTAVISWLIKDEQKKVESYFRLQPSPYTGWDIVQTSLLDDLLAMVD